jgi:hypothetical protein
MSSFPFAVLSENPFVITDLETRLTYQPGRTALSRDRKNKLMIMTSGGTPIPLPSNDMRHAKDIQTNFSHYSRIAERNCSDVLNNGW